MIGFLVTLLVIVLVASLILWVAAQFVSDPMLLKVIRVVVVVLVCLWLIVALAGFAGAGVSMPRWR